MNGEAEDCTLIPVQYLFPIFHKNNIFSILLNLIQISAWFLNL